MNYNKILKSHNFKVSKAGFWICENTGTKVPVTLVQSTNEAFTLGGCRRKIKRSLKRFALELAARRYVVCGYAAAHTHYVIAAEKAATTQFDTENGEKILTEPMTLRQVESYLYGK